LFPKGHFAGPGMTIAGPTTKLPPFTVKSLRISPGSVWDLCSGETFTGCERFSESKAAMVRIVRSVRPVAAPISENVAVPAQAPVPGSGPSLKGLASEYFVIPSRGGARVEVAEKAPEAASRTATGFCREHGWRVSVHEAVQTVQGRTFLADVLCSD